MIQRSLLRHGILYAKDQFFLSDTETDSNYWISEDGVYDIQCLLSEQSKRDGYSNREVVKIEKIKYILHSDYEEYRIDYRYRDNRFKSNELLPMTFFSGQRSNLLDNDIENYIDSYILAKVRERKLEKIGIK